MRNSRLGAAQPAGGKGIEFREVAFMAVLLGKEKVWP
jgi:hypothetical protein